MAASYDEPVLADGPLLGQQGRRVGGAGLGADQTLEDLPGHAEALAVRGEERVQGDRLGRTRNGDSDRIHASVLRRGQRLVRP